jgi:hypothetical protein
VLEIVLDDLGSNCRLNRTPDVPKPCRFSSEEALEFIFGASSRREVLDIVIMRVHVHDVRPELLDLFGFQDSVFVIPVVLRLVKGWLKAVSKEE